MFADHLSGEVIVITQGELVISDDVHIDGSNLEEAPVIDANPLSRVMHYTAAEGDLELTKLTLCNGSVSSSNNDMRGSVILFSSTVALTLTNSIVAGNSDNGPAPDVRPPNDPANNLEVSHSLIGNSTGARLDEARVNLNNFTDVDPLLAPLGFYGGPTQTMPPMDGSPALGAGEPTVNTPATDQRGLPRIVGADLRRNSI